MHIYSFFFFLALAVVVCRLRSHDRTLITTFLQYVPLCIVGGRVMCGASESQAMADTGLLCVMECTMSNIVRARPPATANSSLSNANERTEKRVKKNS